MKAFLPFCLFILISCVTVDENQERRTKPISFSICFWNAKNLNSKMVSSWAGTNNYLTELIKNCDALSLTEINSENVNIANELEELFDKEGIDYSCLDSFHRLDEQGQILNRTKYTTCINKNRVLEMKLLEYPEARNDFSSPPTFIFLELINGAKVSILPFHATLGSKSELIDFEKIVNFAYQKYSERKTFFGGDFYIDKKYHSEPFLNSLLYFRILKNLIKVPTTTTGEKNDAIFTDNITSLNCSGSVIVLDKLSPDLDRMKYSEPVSTHFPVVAKCNIK